jgi:hypothetical protein
MQNFVRTLQVRESAIIELDDDLINDDIEEDNINREYYA